MIASIFAHAVSYPPTFPRTNIWILGFLMLVGSGLIPGVSNIAVANTDVSGKSEIKRFVPKTKSSIELESADWVRR